MELWVYSYYTSFTDLKTHGYLKATQGGHRMKVHGTSWFDHEFGSSQLAEEQQGWDWFSLHLSDGRDLMIYLLRKEDGSLEPASSGTLIEPDGISSHLRLSDVSVSVRDHWRSPKSDARYPSQWEIMVPAHNISLKVAALVANQELDTRKSTGIIYWEGAVAGEGVSRNQKVTCEGYVELTGYAGDLGNLF